MSASSSDILFLLHKHGRAAAAAELAGAEAESKKWRTEADAAGRKADRLAAELAAVSKVGGPSWVVRCCCNVEQNAVRGAT